MANTSPVSTSNTTTLPERATASAERPTVRVGTVRIASGNVNFTDLFIRPNYTANLTNLVGSINAIASDQTEPSDVLITGLVDNDAADQTIASPIAAFQFV